AARRQIGFTERGMSRNLATQASRAPLAERKDDLYETPPEAVRALLRVEPLPPTIWECACGPGSIVRELRAAGHLVYATDLVDYGCPDSEARIDFLLERQPSFCVGAVVTNPPYKLANKFVSHALALGIPKVVMLLRLAFLEGQGRTPILIKGYWPASTSFAIGCLECIVLDGTVRMRRRRLRSHGSSGTSRIAARPSCAGSRGRPHEPTHSRGHRGRQDASRWLDARAARTMGRAVAAAGRLARSAMRGCGP